MVEGPGGQAEGKAAEGVLDPALSVEGDEFIAQDGVAGTGVDGEDQGGEAGDGLQPCDQLGDAVELPAVGHQAHQHLTGNRAPADIDVADEPTVGHLVIDGDAVLVHPVDDQLLDPVGFFGQDQAAVIFDDLMGACFEKARIGALLFPCHRILSLIAIAVAGRRCQDGEFLQILPTDAVQASSHPLSLHPAFFFVIHVVKITTAAELRHRAGPVDAMLGAEVNIPCLDGGYKIKVDPGTQSGEVVRLRGRGLPSVNGYGGTGDLYVKIAVWIPKKLNKDEKEIIESLRSKESFKPNPTKEDKSFFDKLKDLF